MCVCVCVCGGGGWVGRGYIHGCVSRLFYQLLRTNYTDIVSDLTKR